MGSLSTTLQPFLSTSPACNHSHSDSSSWKTLPPLRDDDYDDNIGFEPTKPTQLTIKMPTVTRRLSISSSSSSAYSPHSTSPMGGMSFWPARRRASMGECAGSASSDGWDSKPIKRGILKSPERRTVDLPDVEESPTLKDDAKLRRKSVVHVDTHRGESSSWSGSAKGEEEFGEPVPITACCERCIKAAEYGIASAGEEENKLSTGAQRKLSRDREHTARRASIKEELANVPEIVMYRCGNQLEGEECESLSKLSLAKVDELGPRCSDVAQPPLESPSLILTAPTPPFPANYRPTTDREMSPILPNATLFDPDSIPSTSPAVSPSCDERATVESVTTKNATKSAESKAEPKATPFSLGSIGRGLSQSGLSF